MDHIWCFVSHKDRSVHIQIMNEFWQEDTFEIHIHLNNRQFSDDTYDILYIVHYPKSREQFLSHERDVTIKTTRGKK